VTVAGVTSTGAPSREALRQHLLDSRIAGSVATPREDNLRNFGRMAEGRSNYDFGLVPARDWTRDEVLDVMARRCGVLPDPAYGSGPDTIDVDLTLAALDRVRDRLQLAAQRSERVLVATGHPTGILVLHLATVLALRAGGAQVLVPDDVDWAWPWDDDAGRWGVRRVRPVSGVHMLATGGELLHTHAPEPCRALLAALDAPPDLVVADHGWAGAAAAAGIEVLSYADCNDPALFVAQEEGVDIVVVPLDDNVRPQLYDPLAAYLTSWA
jgi:hypothetical protein